MLCISGRERNAHSPSSHRSCDSCPRLADQSPRRGGPRLVCCASWRSQKRWTQAEFGASLGVSRQTVIAIENGKYDPSLGLAFKIASVFGKCIEDIFYPDPDGQGGGR